MASRNPASPRRGGGMQTNYAAVPQSPQTAHYLHQQHPQQKQQPSQLKPYQSGRSRTHSAGSSAEMPLNPSAHSRPNENTSQAVFTGHIGGGFGPYAVCYNGHLLLPQLTPSPVPAGPRAAAICHQPALQPCFRAIVRRKATRPSPTDNHGRSTRLSLGYT